MIDWGYPTRKDRYLTIDDHVNGYIDDMVDFIRQKTQSGQDQPHGNLHGRHLLCHLFRPPFRKRFKT